MYNSFHFPLVLILALSFFSLGRSVSATRPASSKSSPPETTGEETSDTSHTKSTGCIVHVATAVAYNWQPYLISDASKPSWYTPSATAIPTDKHGTHVGSVTVTTAAYRENGTWVPLTSITTLTFPTPYTNIPNEFVWARTDSSKTGVEHTEMMPTAVLYSATSATIPAIPSEDPMGIGWHLLPTGTTANPAQVSWLRSVYPDVPWLHECKATPVFEFNGTPPIAAQAQSLIRRPSMSQSAKPSSTAMVPLETLATMYKSRETAILASYGPTIAREHTGKSRHTSPRHSATMEVISEINGMPSSIVATTKTLEPSNPVPVPSSSPSTYIPPLKPTADPGLSTPLSSHSFSQSTASLSAGTALGSFGVPGVSFSSSAVVYKGHALAIGSTETFGSGTILTMLALQTNSAGDTILLGDATTLSRETSITHAPTDSLPHAATPSLRPPLSSLSTSTRSPLSSAPPTENGSALISPPALRLFWALLALALLHD